MSVANDEAVAEKLDMLIRLVAIGLCDGKKQKDQIALLDGAGLKPKAIADMLDTTANNVSVTLTTLRKNKAKRRTTGS